MCAHPRVHRDSAHILAYAHPRNDVIFLSTGLHTNYFPRQTGGVILLLASLTMLPLCYWHEYLDILFLFKCAHGLIKTDTMPGQVANQAINLRSTNNTLVTYKIPKVRTLCHQNIYMVRVPRIWNSLPDELRNPDISFLTFKSALFKYYLSATLTVFDVEVAQAWKTICLKCHSVRQLNSTNICCF